MAEFDVWPEEFIAFLYLEFSLFEQIHLRI